MAGRYGTNFPEDEIPEEESRELPDGPLQDLMPVRIQESPELPPQVLKAVRPYNTGEGGELALEIEKLGRKARSDPVRP